jgi:A/G-specific adenine glycosylase
MCGSRRGGRFPSVEAELRAFPGVGRLYRARSRRSPSAAAPLDANIARIVARLTALEEPIARARRNRRGGASAGAGHRAGDLAQALMDIGTMLCPPP